MADNEERRLLAVAGGPEPPARTLAKRQQKRARKQQAETPRTATGESAGDIVGAWVGWYERGAGVPVPQSVISRIGKQVKSLIATGYTTDEIKHGLSFWTVAQMQNDLLSPHHLDRYVWSVARDTRANARQWCDNMRRQVAQFTAAGISNPTMTKDERRLAQSQAAIRRALGE